LQADQEIDYPLSTVSLDTATTLQPTLEIITMAHELTIRANSTAEMAFVGETPWHKLGQQLTEGAPIETWQVAAGMDWKIQRSKVRFHTSANPADFQTWDDQHVLFRSDTKAPLGMVSPGYKVVQPKTVLEFFRDLVDGAGYHLHTAGTLFGGRKFWALAKVGEANVVGQDRVGGFLLLSTSCDGSMATEARMTTVRVVCNNTLSMARVGGGKGVTKVGHRSRFDADSVKASLGLNLDRFEAFMEQARELARRQVKQAEAEWFVRQLLRPEEAKTTAADDMARLMAGTVNTSEQRAPKGEAEILRLFRGEALGSGMRGTDGTAWQLVNAVTQYVDHSSTAKSVDHRLDRAWFGSGDDLKTRAFEMAATL
jgi:phage/plasmid-like protein (TIGR03299 family)